ncbi:MAG: SDR family oxidoreductase [Clostridium tyrobutyricum]|jgi:dTDP-4-dehydrorhamnose reductase|uniref:dTDP-4-dehydrorhamnose reductase family protein n=1 Tax=Clostridium tyrobutyricum TaxID=1519 RepID=UPI002430C871|nr:SDR family oxidoreductase [Clostridium tyrobutyricum]MCH4199435.1 SDR family oxidoreductase [Clostridium tyrobutyricum]MCH4259866.1 SDR family oxidoreductase [Clostridium tyrobutyricum]MCI1240246.1 SDR family oxidoreductase [Clostridium tyrobutyricum]MCI1651639.1 SDR family oxidoreductase [Clostridium tyrobutyricum]MCI1936436.1 SDR family oxidoreductase [Clostridium tyrobutyricum]
MGKIKFLVLGATGMAGHIISMYLYERGYDVVTFSKRPFHYCKNINGDAMNKNFVMWMLQEKSYDVVVNCIGILNEYCDREPSKAIYLNSYLPHLIADILKNTNTKLIHMSTDCVFSGKSGSYSEKSFRDGESFYDRTKALGEVEDDKNLTFRNSIVGPDMKENGIGLFNWFMKQNGIIKGYSKAIWSGVTTLTLAQAIEKATIENITGIYHLVNNESISKFDLLELFNKYMRNEEITILSSDTVNLNKSLVNNRKGFSFQVPSYKQMIIEMKKWIYSHKRLYPHYFK